MLTPEIAEAIHGALSGTTAILIDPVDCAVHRASADRTDHLSTVTDERFSGVLRTIYGYDPSAHAARGYMAAQLTAATVRPAGDRISDKSARRSAFENVCDSALTEGAQ